MVDRSIKDIDDYRRGIGSDVQAKFEKEQSRQCMYRYSSNAKVMLKRRLVVIMDDDAVTGGRQSTLPPITIFKAAKEVSGGKESHANP